MRRRAMWLLFSSLLLNPVNGTRAQGGATAAGEEAAAHATPPGNRGPRRGKLESLTPEQRAEFQKRREAKRQEWKSLSPEERQARRKSRWQEKLQSMPPENRARFEERMKRFEAMTPEERQALQAKRRGHRRGAGAAPGGRGRREGPPADASKE